MSRKDTSRLELVALVFALEEAVTKAQGISLIISKERRVIQSDSLLVNGHHLGVGTGLDVVPGLLSQQEKG